MLLWGILYFYGLIVKGYDYTFGFGHAASRVFGKGS